MFVSRFFKIVSLTFYSKEFYQDLYFNIKSFKFSYLLTLLGVFYFALVFFSYSFINSLLDVKGSVSIVEQLPEMSFEKGILSFKSDVNSVEINDRGNNLAIIDMNSFPEKYINSRIPIFINKSSIFMFNGITDYYKIMDFADYFHGDKILDKEFLRQVFASVKASLLFTVFLIFYPVGLLVKLLLLSANVAIFSLFGLLYGKIVGIKLKFKSVFRVAIFAMFPSIIVELISMCVVFAAHDSFFGFYYKLHSPIRENLVYVLSIGYFYFAIKAISDSKKAKI